MVGFAMRIFMQQCETEECQMNAMKGQKTKYLMILANELTKMLFHNLVDKRHGNDLRNPWKAGKKK